MTKIAGMFGTCTAPFAATPADTARIIDILSGFNQDLILGAGYAHIFGKLLDNFLAVTGSQYGFIGERLIGPDGKLFLKTHAISDIAWNEKTRAFYVAHVAQGLEFTNLASLFGEVLISGGIAISNDPAADPRGAGTPPGHPPLASFLGIPLRLGDRFVGMAGIANRPGGYDHVLCQYLAPLITVTASLISAVAMERIAHYDALTGLFSRRLFGERFHAENRRHARNDGEYSVLMLDIDHFKIINDSHGHLIGDQCIAEVARTIDRNLRGSDIPARFGGDEFVILLPETGRDAALNTAEKLRNSIAAEPLGIRDLPAGVPVTVSIGIVSLTGDPDHALEEVLTAADQALYRAKNEGRNRIVAA
jgi:diguanylate cyclase